MMSNHKNGSLGFQHDISSSAEYGLYLVRLRSNEEEVRITFSILKNFFITKLANYQLAISCQIMCP